MYRIFTHIPDVRI